MRKIIKQITPPLVLNLIIKQLGYIGLSPWKYKKEGFKYNVKYNGWDLDEIAKTQCDKWSEYKKYITSTKPLGVNHEGAMGSIKVDPFFHNLLNSFAYVICLASINKKAITILDWGGGIGHYGLLAEQILKPTTLPLKYYCFDFKGFCDYGKKLNPHFMYEFDKTKLINTSYDLVIASSSIWYEKDWKNGIDDLCELNTEYLYITRMIFIENVDSFVALQQPNYMGYKTEYLFWVINKNEFLKYLETKRFELIREFEFGEVTPIFKAPEDGSMKGYLLKKR